MMISTSTLTLALLCLTASTTNAFVSTQQPSGVVATRGEPLASLVMDRTDVFRPASTHPNSYLPGAPSSSHGMGYGVSSYGPSYGYGYNSYYNNGYYNNDYDRYNRYGYNSKYSSYDSNRSVNDRSYSSYGNGLRRYNSYGSDYNYGYGRNSLDNNYYGNYNNRYYNNNNDYYSNRYSAYGNYGPSSYGSSRYGYGYNDRYNNYYSPRSYSYNSNYNNNWNGSGRDYYSNNWYNRDVNTDRQGAFGAGSTYSSYYSRPSRTSQQLALTGSGYYGSDLYADRPRAFSPGYNWRQ
jgi:hypothetical protein